MKITITSEKTMKSMEVEFSDFQIYIAETIRAVVESFAPKYSPELLYFHEDGKRISIYLEDPELTLSMNRVDKELGKNKIIVTIMTMDKHVEINSLLNKQ